MITEEQLKEWLEHAGYARSERWLGGYEAVNALVAEVRRLRHELRTVDEAEQAYLAVRIRRENAG